MHEKISFKSSFCQKECQYPGVAVCVGGTLHHVTPEKAGEFFLTEIVSKTGDCSKTHS
jgi:hypothetical protein